MPDRALTLTDPGTIEILFSLWLVEVGEELKSYDRVAEILIPGASVDVTAGVAGRLTSRLVVPGERLQSGQVLGTIECEGT